MKSYTVKKFGRYRLNSLVYKVCQDLSGFYFSTSIRRNMGVNVWLLRDGGSIENIFGRVCYVRGCGRTVCLSTEHFGFMVKFSKMSRRLLRLELLL